MLHKHGTPAFVMVFDVSQKNIIISIEMKQTSECDVLGDDLGKAALHAQ